MDLNMMFIKIKKLGDELLKYVNKESRKVDSS